LGWELLLALAGYFTYFGVRGLTEGDFQQALANADRIIDLERSFGLYWEQNLQDAVIGSDWLVRVANNIYIWGHWPVIGLAALWLFLTSPEVYRLFRNAFLISGALGLLIFMTFPVAPPRLVDLPIVDTIAANDSAYRTLQPQAFVNQYAAVPSLHFGWNLLVSIALAWKRLAAWWLIVALPMPALTFLGIVATGNHYVFDAIAGAVVALAGLTFAVAFRKQTLRLRKHQPA
jgi:hypothetical protein